MQSDGDPRSVLTHLETAEEILRKKPAPDVLWQQNHCGNFRSTDAGASWAKIPNLPTTAYDDLILHPREKDLVIGTHRLLSEDLAFKNLGLLVIDEEVDPYLEIAEIHRRVIDNQGPALLFTKVKNSSFPVVTNLFGTAKRLDLAFGSRPQEFVKDIVNLAETIMPPTPAKLWQNRKLFIDTAKIGLKNVSHAPILDNCQIPPKLSSLPMLTSWHSDGGPFVTLPLVYTEHPEGGGHNLGMYRLQVHDPRTTGMHWQIGKGGGYHYAVAEERGEALPVSVFLGGPPATNQCRRFWGNSLLRPR